MFHLIVIISVTAAERIGEVAESLARMRPLCLGEPGCVSWEAYHSADDRRRFVLVEQWETRAQWEAHDDLAAIQTIYLREVLPLITREVHVCRRLP